MEKTSELWLHLAHNIDQDFLEFIIITSQAAGLEQSEMRPFGVGKSTLAILMAYRCFAYAHGSLFFRETYDGDIEIVDLTPPNLRLEIMEMIVRNYVKWSLTDVLATVAKATKPIPALIWDDVQLTAPSYHRIPKKLREDIETLTLLRPLLKNLIMTAPSIGDIAKPLRRNLTAEIIIPKRGVYEVQFIRWLRDFNAPTENMAVLSYNVSGTFEKLPEQIDNLYKQLRTQIITANSTNPCQPHASVHAASP